MPSRYWVGGTAAWDGTAGSKWAATSGGAGGESVPTTADDVFFDAASSGTCTISAGNTGAKSINCTGFTGTITGTAAITVAGSITLDAGQTYTHTGTVTITGTGTLTTAGKVFTTLVVDAAGNTVTLGDALNVAARSVFITRGTFDTDNYNVTASAITSNTSGTTRAINLNASTATLSTSVNFANVAGLTFNAGTSQINLSGTSSQLVGSGQTFHNVSFTNTLAGTRTITGANTFNDLSLTASATGLSQLSLASDQTVNGTFTCAGSSAIARGFVRSDVIGTTRTITAAVVAANDCDFRDITIAGAAAPISPTRAGDCGGNSGITFPAAKSAFRVGTNTTWAGSSSWALTSGGTGSNDNFPLAQDTAVIDQSTTLTGTLALASYNIGSLDASTRTTGITLNHNAIANRYGSYTLGSGVTVSGSSAQTFSGRGTQTFTSAGKTITFPITVDKPAGAFELGDALVSSGALTFTSGTFDAKNYNVTCNDFSSSNSNTRTLTMGSGLWTLSGTGTVWNTTTITGLTFNKDTANILLSNTTTTERTFGGGALSYNKLTVGGATGTSTSNIGGNGVSFTELASIKTVAHTISFTTALTIDTWSITGTAGNVVTVNSSAAGTRRTITLTNVTSGIDYLDVKDIGITDANRFYVGDNSTDSGNNLNVIFTAAPGGAVSLDADVGAFTLAGQMAAALAGRQVGGDAGTFALSGQVANLTTGRALTAASGAFAVTGQAAPSLRGRAIAAEAGTFALVGQDGGLVAGRALSADAGAYAITGQAAALIAGRSLAAGAGAVAVTGQDATLAQGRTLSVNAGAYTVTGQAAALTTGRTVPAAGAAFTLTGQAVTALAGRQASGDAGAYAVTGQQAGLLTGRALAPLAGTFAVTGQDATLAQGRTLSVNAGAYIVTGQAVTALAGRQASGDAGAFTLAGQPAGLLATRFVQADGGAYAATGQDAALATGRRVAPNAGGFALAGQAAGSRLDRAISAGFGAYALAGQAAAFQRVLPFPAPPERTARLRAEARVLSPEALPRVARLRAEARILAI
jgi:hypothetical protein